MIVPDDRGLLTLWERGAEASSLMRPAVLYDALGLGPAAGEAIPIGVRDRALMGARAQLFGPMVEIVRTCDGCAEQVDVQFDLSRLPPASACPAAINVDLGGVPVALALPSTRDIAAALAAPGPDRALVLIETVATSPLPMRPDGAFVAAASAALEAADPDADVMLDLACPSCGTAAQVLFDIGACLWDDIAHAAWRLMREVHLLARAYGWTEDGILALPRRRRRAYLQLGGA